MRAVSSMESMAKEILESVTEQTERTIFQQFINLIRDGVVEIKKTQPVVTVFYNPDSAEPELRMSQYVELTYKGEEVVQRLKQQVSELEGKLRAISLAVKGVGE